MVDPNPIPDVSEEQPVGSNGSMNSGASSSRVLPRVETGDVLVVRIGVLCVSLSLTHCVA